MYDLYSGFTCNCPKFFLNFSKKVFRTLTSVSHDSHGKTDTTCIFCLGLEPVKIFILRVISPARFAGNPYDMITCVFTSAHNINMSKLLKGFQINSGMSVCNFYARETNKCNVGNTCVVGIVTIL